MQTGQKPVLSKARYTVRQFGIRRNENIACHVTVRGEKAMDLLERGLRVKEYELERANFSETGASWLSLCGWVLRRGLLVSNSSRRGCHRGAPRLHLHLHLC